MQMFKEEKGDKDKAAAVDIDYIARYKGQIKNCLRDGEGTYKFPHGGNDIFCYDGTWSKGSREASSAKFGIAGYSQYAGEFRKGEITGTGKRTWADGRTYEGNFQNGEMHGKGKWTSRSGNEQYDGDFIENKRQGFGVLTTGTDIYTGEFFQNQMHGNGTFLYANCCFIQSVFRNNIMNGLALVRWNKIGVMEGTMQDGRATGYGYFVSADGSYDFEGGWENGFPKYSLIAKYIWCDIEKPAIPTEAAGKKAPPPAKAGGPLAIPQGESMGRILIRTNHITLAVANAPVVVAAPVKGKAPAKPDEVPKGTIPEPEPFSVPCERKRKVSVRLRKITNAQNPVELADSDLGPVVKFWIRNQTLSEAARDRTRFPPSCTLYLDGECAGYGSSLSSPPDLLLEPGNVTVQGKLVSGTDTCDDVSALKIEKGYCLSARLPCHEFKRSNDSMTFVVDFKIDVYSLSGCFRQALMQSKIVGSSVQSVGPARKLSSSSLSSKRRMSGARLTSAGASSNSFMKQHIEIPIISLHRIHEGDEISSSRLQLVLIVPDSGLKRMAKKIVKLAKGSNAEDTQSTAGAAAQEPVSTSIGLGNDVVNVDWNDCTWELRLVTYASGPLAPAVSRTVLDQQLKEVDEENMSQKWDHIPEQTSDFQRRLSTGSVTQQVITSSVVCGRWKEPTFSCAQWHSIALTLRANGDSPIYSTSLFNGANTASGSSLFNNANGDNSGLNVVSLVVNGTLRPRAAIEGPKKYEMPSACSTPTASNNQLFAMSLSSPALGSLAKSQSLPQVQEGALLAWLPEWSQSMFTNVPVDSQSNQECRLILRVGGDYFMGFVKTVAICSEGDRPDPFQMTECFEICRQQERLLRPAQPSSSGEGPQEVPINNENTGDSFHRLSNAGNSKDDRCPPNFQCVDNLSLTIVCGSCDFNRIVIPAGTPEGDYVVEVVDRVVENVLADHAPIPDGDFTSESSNVGGPASSLPPASIASILEASHVVTALTPSRQLKFKVIKGAV